MLDTIRARLAALPRPVVLGLAAFAGFALGVAIA